VCFVLFGDFGILRKNSSKAGCIAEVGGAKEGSEKDPPPLTTVSMKSPHLTTPTIGTPVPPSKKII
jgi:hypothetical protein